MTYVRPEVVIDEQAISDDTYTFIGARVSGWQPDERSLDTAIVESNIRFTTYLLGLLLDVSDDIFAAFGTSVIGFPQRLGAVAAGIARFDLLADPSPGSFIIPAGTQIAGFAADGTAVALATAVDHVVPAGFTYGYEQVNALTPGSFANGITGAAQMVSSVPQISTVSITTAVGGGADGEDTTTYLARLVTHLQRLSTHPILPVDFANEAMEQDGVFRALAVDGYKASDNSTGNLRTISVFLQGTDGQPVSSGIKTAVDAVLQAEREVNFVVITDDPLITPIYVSATVVKSAAADATTVDDAVTAAIQAFLAPNNWGPPVVEGDPPWVSKPVVRYGELLGVVYRVAGVVSVTSLTLGTSASPAGTSDITLSSGKPHAIPSPAVSGILVTVS